MRLILALLATALLALAALSAKGAPLDEGNLDLRRSMGNLRPPHASHEANLDLRRSMGNLRPHRSADRPAPSGYGVDYRRIGVL